MAPTPPPFGVREALGYQDVREQPEQSVPIKKILDGLNGVFPMDEAIIEGEPFQP